MSDNFVYEDSQSSESDYEIIINTVNYQDIKESKISKNPLYKTSFCKNIEKDGKCDRLNCDFYHSVEERRIPICSFGNNCRESILNLERRMDSNFGKDYKKCKLCHEWETEESWLKRTGIVYPNNVPEKNDIIIETNPKNIKQYNVDKSMIDKSMETFKYEIYLKTNIEMAGIYALLALEKGHTILRIDIED